MLHGFQLLEINAGNPERTRRFYTEVLGARETERTADHTVLQLGALTLVVRPIRAGWSPVVNCVMPVIVCDRISEDLAALVRQGVAILRDPAQAKDGWHAEVADPDGYRIGLWQPPAGKPMPKLYTEAEFNRKAAALQRDLREAMTATRKIPEIKPMAVKKAAPVRKAAPAKQSAGKKPAAKKAAPAKKKKR